MYGTSSLRRYASYCTCRAARTAGWTPLLCQLSLLTVSTSTSWISPLSTLSASESARWKSSFSKKRPADVGKSTTGRPNCPNQRNSMSRPSEEENQRTYSRYINVNAKCRMQNAKLIQLLILRFAFCILHSLFLGDRFYTIPPSENRTHGQEKDWHPLRHGRHLPLGLDRGDQYERGRSGRGGAGRDLLFKG